MYLSLFPPPLCSMTGTTNYGAVRSLNYGFVYRTVVYLLNVCEVIEVYLLAKTLK